VVSPQPQVQVECHQLDRFLIEQGSSVAPTGGSDAASSAPGIESAPTAETADTATGPVSSTNQPQAPHEAKVHIPHIFSLSGVPMYTPDFKPTEHNIWEENHYHPKSLNDVAADDAVPASFRKKIEKLQQQVRRQQAMNPHHEDAAPEQQKSTVYTRHWK